MLTITVYDKLKVIHVKHRIQGLAHLKYTDEHFYILKT